MKSPLFLISCGDLNLKRDNNDNLQIANITCEKANGGHIMKKKQKINIKIGLMLLAVAALLLAVVPTQACDQSIDQDCDGFIDDLEESTNGFMLPSHLIGVNGGVRLFLDPTIKDSVVILVPSPLASNLDDPFKYVRGFEDGINVHMVQCYPPGTECIRDLESDLGQKAIMAQEILGGSSTLGKCDEEWCTPNSGLDNIKVFTEAIKNHIASKCANIADAKCKSSGGLTGVALENLYIQHTFAHEWGHDGKLRKDNVQKTGGWHYAAKEDRINSQYVRTRTGKTSVTWLIGTEFGRKDFDDLLLWESQ